MIYIGIYSDLTSEIIFFESTDNFNTENYLSFDINSSENKEKLLNFTYIIEATVDRLSQSGKTAYYKFQILDNQLKQTSIKLGKYQISEIGTESWLSLGGFEDSRNQIKYFSHNDDTDNLSRLGKYNFCLFDDFAQFKILDKTSGMKICDLIIENENTNFKCSTLIKFPNENNILIMTLMKDDNEKSKINLRFLDSLKILENLNSYSSFILITLLNQLDNIQLVTQAHKDSFKSFFDDHCIEDLYQDFLKYDKNFSEKNPSINELYDKIKLKAENN